MARPCMVAVPRRVARRARSSGLMQRVWLGALLVILLTALLLPVPPAYAAVQIWLPTPLGERWQIIQGYNCGTHTGGYERLSIDMVNLDGPTRGASVRAAADGTVLFWTKRSGTLILDHGGGFYTQYTHLDTVVTTELGAPIARGALVGTVGNRGAPWSVPHLHFNAFTAKGAYANSRRAAPLAFAEGYDLPEIGGCNQHGGTIVVAGEQSSGVDGLGFRTSAQAGHWYNGPVTLAFGGQAMAGGFSAAWNRDPGGDVPATAGKDGGSAQLTEAGEGLHTLYVRGWSSDGRQTLATFGPIGYDLTPPDMPSPLPDGITAAAGISQTLTWEAARDAASGTAGYRVYIGPDPEGVSDWFVQVSLVETPPLGPGDYLLRVQPIDYAGNTGAWTTIGTLLVR